MCFSASIVAMAAGIKVVTVSLSLTLQQLLRAV